MKRSLLNLVPVMAIVVLGAVAWSQHSGRSLASRRESAIQVNDEIEPPTPRTSQASAGNSEHYKLVSISDGDTIAVVGNDGKRENIRLCGIDAPEVGHGGNKPGQPLGEESKAKLRSLLAGVDDVIVSSSERDKYGRIVGEIFVSAKNSKQPEEERLINVDMVRSGMAYHYAKYSGKCPNGADPLKAAEDEARSQRLGVWGRADLQKPWDYRQAHR